MQNHVKHMFIAGACFVFVILWFEINTRGQADDPWYTRAEFAEDISKIYYDIGHFAEVRKDLFAAVKAYQIAVEKKPDFLAAYNRLDICCKRMHIKKDALDYHDNTPQIPDSILNTANTNASVWHGKILSK